MFGKKIYQGLGELPPPTRHIVGNKAAKLQE
jgi:hypothetical protein